jgi:hypothetical protein
MVLEARSLIDKRGKGYDIQSIRDGFENLSFEEKVDKIIEDAMNCSCRDSVSRSDMYDNIVPMQRKILYRDEKADDVINHIKDATKVILKQDPKYPVYKILVYYLSIAFFNRYRELGIDIKDDIVKGVLVPLRYGNCTAAALPAPENNSSAEQEKEKSAENNADNSSQNKPADNDSTNDKKQKVSNVSSRKAMDQQQVNAHNAQRQSAPPRFSARTMVHNVNNDSIEPEQQAPVNQQQQPVNNVPPVGYMQPISPMPQAWVNLVPPADMNQQPVASAPPVSDTVNPLLQAWINQQQNVPPVAPPVSNDIPVFEPLGVGQLPANNNHDTTSDEYYQTAVKAIARAEAHSKRPSEEQKKLGMTNQQYFAYTWLAENCACKGNNIDTGVMVKLFRMITNVGCMSTVAECRPIKDGKKRLWQMKKKTKLDVVNAYDFIFVAHTAFDPNKRIVFCLSPSKGQDAGRYSVAIVNKEDV